MVHAFACVYIPAQRNGTVAEIPLVIQFLFIECLQDHNSIPPVGGIPATVAQFSLYLDEKFLYKPFIPTRRDDFSLTFAFCMRVE